MDLRDYLLTGSYLVGAGIWAFMWQVFTGLRKDIAAMRREMDVQQGRTEGQIHEQRITRLEHTVYGSGTSGT